MRALVVSIWVFINLVFFGMCGYMYLLWSQYWMFIERQTGTTTSTYDQQIYYYNRGFLPNDSNKTHNETKLRIKHSLKDNVTVTLIKNSKPRFPNLQGREFELDTKKYICFKNDSFKNCSSKSLEFKEKILKELRRVLEDEGNVLKISAENPYNVQYKGTKGNFYDKTPKEIMCELKKIQVKTLKRGDVDRGPHNLGDFLPKRGLFENRKFNSCAIVASAGALKDSNLGKNIDAHDLVLRFNHAPTKGFEPDVGRKTTIRVLNSQVVTRKEFNFLESDIYKNVTIVAWDPSNYKATLDEWLEKPEFNLFPTYIEYKKRNVKARFFLINPQSLWELWDFLQDNSPSRLRRNPLSSGFLGLGILLPLCNFIDVFEYVPSTRVTKRCHYYDPEDNPACTFGVWHPLAAEKLLTYYINTIDDRTVFQDGYVRISGFKNVKC
ncbi:beta-galactoside alpha-2,6-sialyltransferase 1 [Tribolium madens]|uniref:beta-galactoside alpha-2,6-sialyltransferase 1 n=1 Tax=Tribolium madens TaxID=41895 RepID=UPI001CF7261D|nr:beta-galactoside alpha-2,6-sialyltransferase 1 [Tribolium madens]